MSTRRDGTRVIYEILTLAREGASDSQIIRKANLNSRLADRYVSLLSTRGIVRSRLEAGVELYHLTPKGQRVLHLLAEYHRELAIYPSASKPSGLEITPQNASNLGAQFDLNVSRQAGLWLRRILPLLASVVTLLAGIAIGYIIP